MDLSAIIKAVLVPQTDRGGPPALNLQPGDQLVGKVLQLESDGRVLIDLDGTRVLAQMGFDVKQGQSLKLTVVAKDPLLHLRADPQAVRSRPPPTSTANAFAALSEHERMELLQTIRDILHRLAGRKAVPAATQAVAHALKQIQTVFDPLPMGKPTADIAQWLRQSLENHGTLFEKRLADIEKGADLQLSQSGSKAMPDSETKVRAVITRDVKAQMILLKNFLASSDDAQASALKLSSEETALLRDNVERMLHHTQRQQSRTVTRSREGEPYQVISHMLPMDEGRPPVRLNVYYPRKEGRETTPIPHRIAILLDMDRLGWVRGDIAKTDGLLQIQFYVQDESVRSRFLAQLHRISSALEASFDQVRVNVTVSKEKIEKFDSEGTRGVPTGQIDIKV